MPIKFTIITLVILGALGLIIYGQTVSTSPTAESTPVLPPADTFIVTLTPDGYVPAEFTVPVGTAVTFVSTTGKPHWPASNLHPTHEIYAEFDPLKPIDPDKSWTFVFDKEGTWNFHDHMRAYYTGTIEVVAAQ